MSIYRLFSKSGPTPDKDPDTDLVCLAERFNWFAFLLPPFWAATHGLWREFIAMFGALFGLLILENFFVLPAFWLYFLFAIWLGLEANRIHAKALMRSGWHWEMDLIAADQLLAQSRFWRQNTKESQKAG